MPVSLLFHNTGSNLAQILPQDHTHFDFICWFLMKYVREFKPGNLEMEPKYLTKSDVNVVSCFSLIFEKNLEFTS